jgi:hypothetical protein
MLQNAHKSVSFRDVPFQRLSSLVNVRVVQCLSLLTNELTLWNPVALLPVRNNNTSVPNCVCVTFILARVVLSLLHVSGHMGHHQASRIQKC